MHIQFRRAAKPIMVLVLSCLTLLFTARVSTTVIANEGIAWFADHGTLYRVGSQNDVIDRIVPLPKETTDIAIDSRDQSVWVLSHKHLQKFNADTSMVFERSWQEFSPQFADPRFVRLDPFKGNLWVAANRTLILINQDGQRLSTWQAPDQIDDLSLDLDESLWVLAKGRLYRVSASGAVLSTFDVSSIVSNAKFIAVDSLGGVFWVASKSALGIVSQKSFNASPPAVTISDPAGIQYTALDTIAGVLWISTNDNLLAYNRYGQLLHQIPLPARLKPVERLAVDPISHRVWVGTKKLVARINASKIIEAEFIIKNELEALAVSRSGSPNPNISIISPIDNVLINNAKPEIRLELSGRCGLSPCQPSIDYLDNLSLDVLLNGNEIGGLFDISNESAAYFTVAALPEGINTLKAQATDVYGHKSEEVSSQFVVDTVPPKFIRLAPIDKTVFTTPGPILISGAVDDAAAQIKLLDRELLGGMVIRNNPIDFAFSVPLKPGLNAFTIMATDQATNASEMALQVFYQLPLTLNIVSPKNGATITGTSVAVTGTLTGPLDTSINVNGVSAGIDENGHYSALEVPLVSGKNVLTVTAVTPDGRTKIETVTVFAGGGGWGQAVKIEQGGLRASSPDIAMPNCVSAIAVWSDFDDNGASIYANHYVVGGNWSSEYVLSNDNSSWPHAARYPQIDSGGVGTAIVGWTEAYISSTYGRHYGKTNAWSPMRTLSTSLGGAPRVSMNSLGDARMLWIDGWFPDGLESVNYSNVAGWGLPSLVKRDNYYTVNPALAINSNGNAAAIWQRTSNSRGFDIWANNYNNQNGWSASEQLTTQSEGLARFPEVAMAENGTALAVWMQQVGTKAGIWSSRYDETQGWQVPVELDPQASYRSALPDVAMNSAGQGIAVWLGIADEWATNPDTLQQDYRGRTLQVSHFDPISGWSAPVGIMTGALLTRPKITVNKQGRFLLVWSGYDNLGTDGVWASFYEPGIGWDTPAVIGQGTHPKPAVDDCGDAVVIWRLGAQADVWANAYSVTAPGSVPEVTAPADLNIEATGAFTIVELGNAVALDELDGPLIASPDKTGPFPLGDHVVIWTATNSAGRTGTAIQKISVRDTIRPELSVPDAIYFSISDPDAIPVTIDIGQASASDIFPVTLINNAPLAYGLGTTSILWQARDANGNSRTGIQTVTVEFTGPVYIRITNPSEDNLASSDVVNVNGDYLGPSNTGITINGVIADTRGGHFFANNVPLPANGQLIAVASTPSGDRASHTITIESSRRDTYYLYAKPDSGYAPFTTEFIIGHAPGAKINQLDFDFDGDGSYEFSTTDTGLPVKASFTDPGVYPVTVVIRDNTSLRTILTVTLVVNEVTEMDARLRGVYQNMLEHLRNQDIDNAMHAITSSMYEKYRHVFESIGPGLPTAVNQLGTLKPSLFSQEFAEYALIRGDNGNQRAFLLYFLQGEDGVWRIDGM